MQDAYGDRSKAHASTFHWHKTFSEHIEYKVDER
jgi:hypothetical protein